MTPLPLDQNAIYFVVVTLAAAFGLATHTISNFKSEFTRLSKKVELESNRLEATSWAVFDTSVKFLVRRITHVVRTPKPLTEPTM